MASGELGVAKNEERFLSAQADLFAGAKGEEKTSACCIRNDSVGVRIDLGDVEWR